jgi:hypothetical protein
LFDQNSWWCRQGLLWSNFCLVHDLMQQIDDADSLICGIEVHAVGPFAREDPAHPPSDPDHPLPLERRPRTPLSGRNQTRLDPAAQQWQAYGFLELDEESPRPTSKQSPTRLLPDVGASPPKGRQTLQGRGWSGYGTLEPINPRGAQTMSRGTDLVGVGLSRSIHSRSDTRLSRLGTPMALQDAVPTSPAYAKMGRAGSSPGGSRAGSRAHSPPRF